MILGRILCYILVVFEQDIIFGAYLTLQAESTDDVDVFKQKSWLTINRCCPTPYMSWTWEAKKLDAQSHKLEVNNSVVSVQTVLVLFIVPYMSQYPFSAIDFFAPVTCC